MSHPLPFQQEISPMPSALQKWFALSAVLLSALAAQAQTDYPCRIVFQNLSRETFNIRNVSVLQADGSKKEPVADGQWAFKPGDRGFHSAGQPIEGRQITFTIVLPDGAKSTRMTNTKQPATVTRGGVVERNLILVDVTDYSLAEYRKEDKGRALSKAEATYRYWNTVHGIWLEQSFDMVQNLDFPEPSKIVPFLRTMANWIDDLDTTGVDEDAVAAAKAFTALQRKGIKVMSGITTAKMLVIGAELFKLKVDSVGKLLDEGQKIAGDAEDVSQFLRSRRKALEKRYNLAFPHLTPPIVVNLRPYTFSKGFYVTVSNFSGDDIKNVQVGYRDAAGNAALQPAKNRLAFNPGETDGAVELVPDKYWRVDPGEWITVYYEGGAYTYPTSKLIRK
jgi:hypothetical protein